MNLQEFLNKNKVKGLTKEVALADRFRDENGKLLKFKIKTMTRSEYDEIQKRATKLDEKGNSNIDDIKLEMELIINYTVYPNFKDTKNIKEAGAVTAEDYVEKVLLAGEIGRLATEILYFSGFKNDINELVEEAKN